MEPEEKEILVYPWVGSVVDDWESDEIAVTAGYGTGKSFGSWQILLEKMRQNPDCKYFAYCEPTAPLIEKVAHPTARAVLEEYGAIEGIHYKIISDPKNPRLEAYWSDQVIRFVSMHEPDSIVGFEAGVAVVDEAANCKRGAEAMRRLKARMRAKGMRHNPQIILPTTPEGMGWFSEMFDSDAQPGWEGEEAHDKSKIIKVADEEVIRRRIRLETYMNKRFLPPGYIANLLETYGHSQNYIDSYIFGFFRPFTQGLAYKEYKSHIHKTTGVFADFMKPINLTWDFNIQPVWVAIQEAGGNHYCIDNANHDGETLDEAIFEFVGKFPREKFANTPILIWGDPSGHARSHKVKGSDFKNIVNLLRKLGYRQVGLAAPKGPAPLERVSVDFVNREFLNRTLHVNEKCDRVLKSLSRTTWRSGQKAKLDKPSGDTWTHPMDAVKYYIWAKNHRPVMI